MKRKISNDINGNNHNVVVVGRFRNRQKWVDELRGIGTAFKQAISRLAASLKKSEHTGNNRIDMELAVGDDEYMPAHTRPDPHICPAGSAPSDRRFVSCR